MGTDEPGSVDGGTGARSRYPEPLNEGRSRNMRANRRTDTKPEVALRRALHKLGYRYRKDFRLDLGTVRVRPDIVFTARKVAVFVDGCFWHVCPVHGRKPTTNEWYWNPKLERNVERDRAADSALTAAGWQVVRLWEHEPLDGAVSAVVGILEGASEHVSDPMAHRGAQGVATLGPDSVCSHDGAVQDRTAGVETK